VSETNRRAAIGLPPAPGLDSGATRRRAMLSLWAFLGGGPLPDIDGDGRTRSRNAWTTGLLSNSTLPRRRR
jgi:hypothetical protein